MIPTDCLPRLRCRPRLPRGVPAALALAIGLTAGAAHALECPAAPAQSHRDWDVEVHTEVGKIGRVKGAELRTRVRTSTQDLLTKLPNADKLYLEQMMFAAYCTALRDDAAMQEAAKAKQILAYRRELRASFQAHAR